MTLKEYLDIYKIPINRYDAKVTLDIIEPLCLCLYYNLTFRFDRMCQQVYTIESIEDENNVEIIAVHTSTWQAVCHFDYCTGGELSSIEDGLPF